MITTMEKQRMSEKDTQGVESNGSGRAENTSVPQEAAAGGLQLVRSLSIVDEVTTSL
jgi:hypothetical protein